MYVHPFGFDTDWLNSVVSVHSTNSPVYGVSLEEHLRRTNRDISVVLEDCVVTLLEVGMEEEVSVLNRPYCMQGSHVDWKTWKMKMENLENENGHGKVAKSHGIFFISHGILPILPPNCTKFVFFWLPLRN